MTDTPIQPPMRGLNDNRAYGEQPHGTTERAKNVRVVDPVTGRARVSQREGLVKHFPNAVSPGSPVLRLNHLNYDKKKFTYEALRGDSDTSPAVDDVSEEWAVRSNNDKSAINVQADANGNRYFLIGHTLEKVNTDGVSLWTIAIPVSDKQDILGPIAVDLDSAVYVGVSGGSTQTGASVFRVWQKPIPNSFSTEPIIEWEWVVNRWVREIVVHHSSLRLLLQDDLERRSYVRTLYNISLAVPSEGSIVQVTYPSTCMVVKKDGSIVTGHPAFDNRDSSPFYPGTKLPIEKWTIENLPNWEERVWSWYRASDIAEAGGESGGDVTVWPDRSGNGRHLTRGGETGTINGKGTKIVNPLDGDVGKLLSATVLFGTASIASGGIPPTLDLSGSFPNSSVRFNGLQSLFSAAGGGKDSQRDACKTAVPNHGDGAFCTFIVCRPGTYKTPDETDDSGNLIDHRRFLFGQSHHTKYGGGVTTNFDTKNTGAYATGILINSDTLSYSGDNDLFCWGKSYSLSGSYAMGYARAFTSSSGYKKSGGSADLDGYVDPASWISGTTYADWPGMPEQRGGGRFGWPDSVQFDDPNATELGEGMTVFTFMHCGGLDEALAVPGSADTTSYTVTDATLLKNYPNGATTGTWTLYEANGTSIGAVSNIDTSTGVLTIPSSTYSGTAYLVPPRNLMSRSLFRSNGMPADRWEALPMGFNGADVASGSTFADFTRSIENNVEANRTGIGIPFSHHYIKGFVGEITEMITLGRRLTNSDRVTLGGVKHHVYPSVVDHPMYASSSHVNDVPADASYADVGSNLGTSELEKIEGWLAHRHGIPHRLNSDTYPHPHYPDLLGGVYDIPQTTESVELFENIAGTNSGDTLTFTSTDTKAFNTVVGNQGRLVLDGVDVGFVTVTGPGTIVTSGPLTPGAAVVTSLNIVGGKNWIGRLRNPTAQILKTDTTGDMIWCLVSDKQRSGLAVGDIVTKDINGVSVNLLPGPEPTSGLALDSDENILWVGPGVGTDGTYFAGRITDSEDITDVESCGFYDSVGGADPDYEVLFPPDVTVRPKVDEWGNLIIPIIPGCTHSTVDPVEAVRMYGSNGVYMGNVSTLLHGSSTYQNCWALSLPLENPIYDSFDFLLSPSVKRPEFLYLALERDDHDGGSAPEIAKWRIVSSVPTADSGSRLTDYLAVAGTHVWYDLSDTWTKATDATTAFDSASGYVGSTLHDGKIYYTDGANYRVYSPQDKTVDLWKSSGSGTMPKNCLLITTYRDRVVLARGGQKWFMSAVNDPLNWDYFPPVITTDQAIAGTLSPAGQSKDIINAMIGGGDDYLIFGCDSSIWRLTGDPMKGGELDEITGTIGVAFGDSMCRDESGMIYLFATTGGVYTMAPLGQPTCISDATDGQDVSVQRRLNSINLSTHRPVLVWDHLRRGLRVIQIPYDVTSTDILKSWFWDKKNNAWLEDEPGSADLQPFTATVFDGDDPTDRALVIGSKDGYVRRSDNDAVSDDSVAIDSHVTMGPFAAGDDMDIAVDRIRAVLAESQGGVEWQIQGANGPDGLDDADILASGRFEPGISPRAPVFQRAAYIWISLRNVSATERWSLEALIADFEQMGTRSSL